MDILRKEINAIYDAQKLDVERLPYDDVGTCLGDALNVSRVTDGCAVITDAARDCCHIFAGNIATVLGLSSESNIYRAEFSSGDEDIIYNRLHPEDLVEKRMLEYEFFKFVDRLSPEEKTIYRAACRLRLRDKNDRYILIDNTTRIHRLSPAGKIWLILCTYDISALSDSMPGIHASIINELTGDVRAMNFGDRRNKILTGREKEILLLIRDGLQSKEIADRLGISTYTVSRHRQNILSKLSVGNSIEAIAAATAMSLL